MNNTKLKKYAPLELKQISQIFASKYTGENKEVNYFTGENWYPSSMIWGSRTTISMRMAVLLPMTLKIAHLEHNIHFLA